MKTNIRNYEDFVRTLKSLKGKTKEIAMLTLAYPQYSSRVATQYWKGVWDNEVQATRDKPTARKTQNDFEKSLAGQKNNGLLKPLTNQERAKFQNKITQPKQQQKATSKFTPNDIQQMIINEANRQGLDPNIALAVAQNESGFNPNAIGDNGNSFGIFQINKPAHPDYTGGLDPQKNIEYGVGFLKRLHTQNGGDIRKTLERYNGSGPMARAYSDKVYSIYQSYANGTNNFTPSNSSLTQTQTNTSNIEPAQFNQDFKNYIRSLIDQEGGLNNQQDSLYQNNNQQALNRKLRASDFYKQDSYNPQDVFGVNKGLKDLFNMVYPQQTQEVKENSMANNYEDMWQIRPKAQIPNQMAPIPYGEMLGELRPKAELGNQPQNIRPNVLSEYMALMNNINNPNAQTSQQLIEQYNNASRRDDMMNTTNAFINSMMAGTNNAPVSYVSAKGNLNQIQLDQPNTNALLPTDKQTNVKNLSNQLTLQQQASKANKDIADQMLNLKAAEAFSRETGLPTEYFLDDKIRQGYLQYIMGPEATEEAKFRGAKKLLPYSTASEVIKTGAIGNKDYAIEKLKGKNQLDETELKYNLAGRNQQDHLDKLYGYQNKNNILKLYFDMYSKEGDWENALAVQEQMGKNQQDLANLMDSLKQNNPYEQMRAIAAYFTPVANTYMMGATPQQSNQMVQGLWGSLEPFGIKFGIPTSNQSKEESFWNNFGL